MGLTVSSFPVTCNLCRTKYPYPTGYDSITVARSERKNYMKLVREMKNFPEITQFIARYRKIRETSNPEKIIEYYDHYYRCDRCIGDDKIGWEYRKEGFICHNY
ncbi:MAG: hypothetical protein AAB966_00695 [Patescibacteria group bacterium]